LSNDRRGHEAAPGDADDRLPLALDGLAVSIAQVPTDVAGVEPHILHPRKTWQDKPGYDAQAARLVGMFLKNFEKFERHVDRDVVDAAPGMVA